MASSTLVSEIENVLGTTPRERLQHLFRPHVESFNFFLGDGMARLLEDLEPQEVVFPNNVHPPIELSIQSVVLRRPMMSGVTGEKTTNDVPLFPKTCREAGISYTAECSAQIHARSGSGSGRVGLSGTFEKNLGRLPIMVMSERCNLAGYGPRQLVKAGEEANEMGGYFIVNGLEKIVRMLITPRKNHILAVQRGGWAKRGANYSDLGVQFRSVRPDCTTASLTLHYLKDGNCMMRFTIRKAEYFIPAILLLRAFRDTNDRELYERLTRLDENDPFVSDRVEFILGELRKFSLFTRDECLVYMGSRFRPALRGFARQSTSALEVGRLLLKHFVFPHLGDDDDAKFDLLVEMVRKLYAFAKGDISPDHPDSLINQDVMLGGYIYLMLFKENLQKMLFALAQHISADCAKYPSSTPEKVVSKSYFSKMTSRVHLANIGKRMEHWLATGNLVSDTGLDFQQTTGFAVIAEKLNYLRYLSHFRCVHRGQFFTTMKTTAVRKLLPDSWGFMCPVHTPDGAPCGLLNHLAHYCSITMPHRTDLLPIVAPLLEGLGMTPVSTGLVCPSSYLPVMLDGRLLGHLPPEHLASVTTRLRFLKSHGMQSLPRDLEVAAVPRPQMGGPTEAVRVGGQYPGLFLFTTPMRFSRPTLNLRCNKVEYLSPFEQAYLNIAVLQDDLTPSTTHAELKPTSMLSLVASCTPFSDFNQSPRNMYQCQMAKQTMGTPCHSWHHRVDTKMYRLQTPQKPITRNQNQEFFPLNEYPNGTNAVVAVISYTGYDMEDAMIINKGSYDRGFKHASVYSVKAFDIWDGEQAPAQSRKLRYLDNRKRKSDGSGMPVAVATLPDGGVDPACLVEPSLGLDGLPAVGQYVECGDPLYCYFDELKKCHSIKRSKQKEPYYVDQVRRLGWGETEDSFTIKMRFNRNPVVGDKFASRHGQKGVMSKLYPQEDMPFAENGIVPDLIINPHAFPSRMTIGMLIESMAGKSGALHGIFQSSTPFSFDETQTPADYFGDQLVKAGYNYHGNETMYSGVTGEPFAADIFIGVVYYQRLRHMVSDKYQVRSLGPINAITHQPVKGRKAGGGIRLGEMERDSLLAHGTSFILNDRLQNCSDRHVAHVCRLCGSMLSTSSKLGDSRSVSCLSCSTSDGIETVALPYVFRYLTNELAAMNIRVTLEVKPT